MPLPGKFVGPGIYIEDLEETHSYAEIRALPIEQFKQLCGFMEAKELQRLMEHLDTHGHCIKYSYIQNILV